MAPSAKLAVKEAGLKVTTPEPARTRTSATPPTVKAQDSANPLNPSPTGSDEIKKLAPDSVAQLAQGVGADASKTPSSSSAKSTRKRTPTPKAATAPAAQKKTRGIKAPAAKVVKNNSRSPKRKADDLEDDDVALDEDAAATSPRKCKNLKLSTPKKPARGKSVATTTAAACSIADPPLFTAVGTKLTAVEKYIRAHDATPSLTFEPNTQITTVFRHDVFTALILLNVHFELSDVENTAIDLCNLIIETTDGGVHEDWNRERVDLSVDLQTGEAIRGTLAEHQLRNCLFLMWELDRIVMKRGAHTLLGAVDPRWRYESGTRDPNVATYAEEGPIGEAASFAGLGGFRTF
ncbi:hypothetical protein B0A48_06217 [Cryoendolithus antarcticus]|uniref:Uncharacterized protein n=1 Tax=Cryoendolithus antarcticus TaxID=1507870 RepID=A0A1V8TAA8_9PEZI|nr:hypothetical protein B0A48_06217 [Cryoendolithus antarcticus]